MLATLMFSCTREPSLGPDPLENGFKTIHYEVTATGATGTKASLNGNTQYIFSAGDRLFVSHVENNEEVLYGVLTLVSGAGETSAYFEGDLFCAEEFENDLSSSTTLKVTLVSANDEIHTVSNGKLISTAYDNSLVADSFEEAVEKFSDFTCNSTFGSTRFTLSQNTSFLIFNIKLMPSEAPAGTPVTLSISNGSTPVWSTTVNATAYNTITRTYFVAGIEGGETTLSNAKLSLSWTNAQTPYSKEFNNLAEGTLAANHYYTVAKSTLTFDGFRIRAQEDGTEVYFYYIDGSVEYSTDYGETWNVPPTQANGGIHLDADEEACFRGTRTECNLKGNKQLFTTNSKECYIAGEITSLLGTNPLSTDAFRSAFSFGNTSDSDAETKEKNISVVSTIVDWVDIDPTDPLILPASTAANCYMEMFLNCTSLTSAPALPATVLADKCYFRMFYGCPISSIPSFPSVVTMSGTSTRRRYCFQMFQYCTEIESLTEPLPVGQNSTLARGCFEDMFAHCTSLTSVCSDLLPATTLAVDCYRGMFQDTRFATAPDLLATTLVSECYRFMFNGCTNLNYIKCLATTNISSNGYTSNWVGGVAHSGTFVKDSNASWTTNTDYTNNTHGTPKGWTVQDNNAQTP